MRVIIRCLCDSEVVILFCSQLPDSTMTVIVGKKNTTKASRRRVRIASIL